MENKPICYLPERQIPEIYSGVPTFLGLPKIADKQELAQHDIVIMGAPYENICTWGSFSGCELATKTIRRASARYGGYLPDFDLDIFDHFSGGDYGDAPVQNGNADFSYAAICQKYNEILAADKLPLVFGGDHSVSYPLIREFAKKHNGNVGIIHFDSHMDNIDRYGEELYARCSPFHRLYEEEKIDNSRIVHVGIRGPRNNETGLREAKKFGAAVITGYELKTNGCRAAMEKAIAIAGRDNAAIYVTICSDVLDVANNPGGPADPCGSTTFELAMMLHQCGKAGAKGFDYVEVYPSTDHNDVSSHNACWMAIYFLQGVTKHKLGIE